MQRGDTLRGYYKNITKTTQGGGGDTKREGKFYKLGVLFLVNCGYSKWKAKFHKLLRRSAGKVAKF